MQDVTYADPQILVTEGLLHEINRLLLHGLGLALQVEFPAHEDGSFTCKLWDERDDPEGIYFDGTTISAEKAEHVAELLLARRKDRHDRLGFVIQPVDNTKPILTTTYLDPTERTRV